MLIPNRFVIFRSVVQFQAALSNLRPAQTGKPPGYRDHQFPSAGPFSRAPVPNIGNKSQSVGCRATAVQTLPASRVDFFINPVRSVGPERANLQHLSMSKIRLVAFLSGALTFCGSLRAQSPDPAAQLVRYVHDARKAGLKDSQILRNAEEAGWSADAVKSAMASPPAGLGQPKAPAPAAAEKSPPVAAPPTETTPEAKTEPETKTALPPAVTSDTAPDAFKNRNAPDDYVIGAGDVLQIAVWREPDASVQSTVVRPDGKISMPLLKEVPVLGVTVVEAEQLITRELAKFLTAPDVTVVVTGIHSKKIYITGAVKREGPIAYSYRMTVLQAISEAGGLTDYAKRKKIYVLHYENGRQFTFPFDYNAVLKGQRMELNIYLTPGDTLVVPH
jgi:polysaccharide biosynthesis/export protein